MRSSQLPHDVEADEEVQVGIVDMSTGEIGSRAKGRCACARVRLRQLGSRPGNLWLAEYVPLLFVMG
jgi:hypothetical protein